MIDSTISERASYHLARWLCSSRGGRNRVESDAHHSIDPECMHEAEVPKPRRPVLVALRLV